MLIVVGGPKPLPERVVLGCIRKLAKHESVRKSTVFLREKNKTQKYDKQQLIVRVVRQGLGQAALSFCGVKGQVRGPRSCPFPWG